MGVSHSDSEAVRIIQIQRKGGVEVKLSTVVYSEIRLRTSTKSKTSKSK